MAELKIVNPYYDSALKFLFEDKEAAKVILSDLLLKEVVDLGLKVHKFMYRPIKELDMDIRAYVFDFDVKVETEEGLKDIFVTIERDHFPINLRRLLEYEKDFTFLMLHYKTFVSVVIFDNKIEQYGNIPIVKLKPTVKSAVTNEEIDIGEFRYKLFVQLPLYENLKVEQDIDNFFRLFKVAKGKLWYEVEENDFPAKYHKVLKRLNQGVENSELLELIKEEDSMYRAINEYFAK